VPTRADDVSTRDAPTFLHVDLDAFYASVEQLLRPELRGTPVVVGGTGPRGVVSAASYEARAYGVRSAMPMAVARRRCPHATFLPPRFDEYERCSNAVMAILRDVTPIVEQLSIDEAFLDVGGAVRRLGPPDEIARTVRRRVLADTGLRASVGAATTKFLAKLASEEAKPDGMLVIAAGTELDFLHPLPVTRLWGVGPATHRKLQRIGARTIGDVARMPEAALAASLGSARARHLHALAQNVDARPVETSRPTKSIGNEQTFAVDLVDRDDLERELLRIADRVGERLRRAGLRARTITLKVRFADFRTITRARTLDHPTDVGAVVHRTTTELLAGIDATEGIRLLGISGSGLVGHDDPTQQSELALDDDEVHAAADGERERRRADVERAVDEIRSRFGDRVVGPATLLSDRRR
jgi:DNA polymerase-4